MAKKQWKITARVDTALCIGDSGSSDTGVDRATVKTSDGKLYIPASTLKGIWRHVCEAIAKGQGNFVCESPRAENMCEVNPCIICQIFGSPTSVSKIFISDLDAGTDLTAKSTEIRNSVTINRERRVAEDQRLFFTETSLSNAEIEFAGNVTIDGKITDEQLQLLKAGLKYIHAIGSGKTYGLGWLKLTQKELTPETQQSVSITPDTSVNFTELIIKVELMSPMLPGGRKQSGKAIEAVQYIRGGLLRGAVANAWLLDPDSNETGDDFNTLFLSEDAGIFRNCYPGPHVLPATAVGCKDFRGFIKSDDDNTGTHGIFDTLIERLVAEKTDWIYHPSCSYCEKGRVESQSGFYTKSNGKDEENKVNTRLLTRVAINRKRRVSADELLYSLNAIDPLTVNGENIIFYGSARVPSSLVNKVANTLQNDIQRLGGGTSRGLGQVRIKVENRDNTDTLSQRISDFNNHLQAVFDTYSSLPNVEVDALESTYFSIALQSDAILTENWQRSMTLTAEMLQEVAGCQIDVELIRSFASYDYVSGWNAKWGLPKEVDLVTRAGSVFVFRTSDIEKWIPALRTLEKNGVGNRSEEGFGQILICDPFHLQTQE